MGASCSVDDTLEEAKNFEFNCENNLKPDWNVLIPWLSRNTQKFTVHFKTFYDVISTCVTKPFMESIVPTSLKFVTSSQTSYNQSFLTDKFTECFLFPKNFGSRINALNIEFTKASEISGIGSILVYAYIRKNLKFS